MQAGPVSYCKLPGECWVALGTRRGRQLEELGSSHRKESICSKCALLFTSSSCLHLKNSEEWTQTLIWESVPEGEPGWVQTHLMTGFWPHGQHWGPHSRATVLTTVTLRVYRRNADGQLPNSVPAPCPVGRAALTDADALPVTPKPGNQRAQSFPSGPGTRSAHGIVSRAQGAPSFHSELFGRHTRSELKPRAQGWKLPGWSASLNRLTRACRGGHTRGETGAQCLSEPEGCVGLATPHGSPRCQPICPSAPPGGISGPWDGWGTSIPITASEVPIRLHSLSGSRCTPWSFQSGVVEVSLGGGALTS